MKLPLTILLLSVLTSGLRGQTVNEVIHFDDPNDQVNHFYGMQSLVQIQANGITGGCLLSPDSNDWGNDNSYYCSKYECLDSLTYRTTMSFFWADSIINPSSIDRAASIWLKPFSDPNHYVIATLSHDKKIELITYFSADNLSITPSIYGTWYQLQLTVTIHMDSMIMEVMLVDLGPDGSGSLPQIAGNLNVSIEDSVFARDSAIAVSITGSRYGGSIYLDDFTFSGIKSADSCLFSPVVDPNGIENTFLFSMQQRILTVSGRGLSHQTYNIFAMDGRKVKHGRFPADYSPIDLTELRSGVYLISIQSAKGVQGHRFYVSE